MPIHYVYSSRGFGLRTFPSVPSPYVCAALGPPPSVSERRTQLRMSLLRNDMLEMGSNSRTCNDPLMYESIRLASLAFCLENRVNPYHLNDLFFMPSDIRASSAGLPWSELRDDDGLLKYPTRGSVMDDPATRNSIRLYWHKVKRGDKVQTPDTKVVARAHMQSGGRDKIRAVYCYPTTITLGEAQFARPLIAAYKRQTTPIAYGYDMATGGARRLRRHLASHSTFACLDFKCFDKTVSKQLIYAAFNILFENIDFRRYQGEGIPIASNLVRAWLHIVDYFVNTKFRFPTGEVYKKDSGVPSGSYFTQLINV